jgi:hypothetical protein
MKIKVLLCSCERLNLIPENLDLHRLRSELDEDVDVAYALEHPELCGTGGLGLLQDLLKAAEEDTYFILAGCGPEQQQEMLGHAIDLKAHKIVSVNVRGCTTAQARDRILETVGRLATQNSMSALVTDGLES